MMGGGAADNLSYMGELFFSEDNLKAPSKGASAEEVIAHEIVHQWWGSQCPSWIWRIRIGARKL